MSNMTMEELINSVAEEVIKRLKGKADKANTYTKNETDAALSGKQPTLVSGTNIKTLNNQSLLGEGDITISVPDPSIKTLVKDGGANLDMIPYDGNISIEDKKDVFELPDPASTYGSYITYWHDTTKYMWNRQTKKWVTGSNWTTNGLPTSGYYRYGKYIWTDGTNYYYSNGEINRKWDPTQSTPWVSFSGFTGLTYPYAPSIFKDKYKNVYHMRKLSGTGAAWTCYKLNGTAWTEITVTGLPTNFSDSVMGMLTASFVDSKGDVYIQMPASPYTCYKLTGISDSELTFEPSGFTGSISVGDTSKIVNINGVTYYLNTTASQKKLIYDSSISMWGWRDVVFTYNGESISNSYKPSGLGIFYIDGTCYDFYYADQQRIINPIIKLNDVLESVASSGDYNDLKNTPDLSNKVDKEAGKGLSTNDFTNIDKGNISKALYFKGAYDSADGKTRQTWVRFFTGNESWAWDSSNNTWYTLVDYFGFKDYGGVACSNGLILELAIINATSGVMRCKQADNPSISSSSNMNALCNSSVFIQYELTSSYTDDGIIENQSLLPLDSGMANELRGLITDGLNLYFGSQNIVLSNTDFVRQQAGFTLTAGQYIWNATISGAAYPTMWLKNGSTTVVNIEPNTVFTISSDTPITTIDFYYNGATGAVGSCTFTNIMLVEGSHPYPYEKFNGKLARVPYVNKALYNLGAFDGPASGNSVPRKAGYILDFSKIYLTKYSDGFFYTLLPLPNISSSSDYTRCKLNGYTTENVNSLSNLSNLCCSVDGSGYFQIRDDSCITIEQMLAKLQGHILQYELATAYQYTESVIPNQPLLNLDQAGCNWVRNEWEKGLNLFNKNVAIIGYYDAETHTIVEHQNWRTEYIPCEPNTTYYTSQQRASGVTAIIFLDSNKGFLSYTEPSALGGTFTTPANCYYMLPNCSVDYYQTLMIVEGSTPRPYQEYHGKIVHEADLGVKLWENGSPTSSFADNSASADRLDIGLGSYKYFYVGYKFYDGSNWGVRYAKFKNTADKSYVLSDMNLSFSEYMSRSFTVYSDYRIAFSDCYNKNAQTSNDWIVPVEIWGAKK